jgi:hypothetical protein
MVTTRSGMVGKLLVHNRRCTHMKFWPLIEFKSIGLFLIVLLLPALAQRSPSGAAVRYVNQLPAVLSRVKVVLSKDGPAVEITSSRRIVPSITKLEGPLRMVIDLQNVEMSISKKPIKVQSEDIGAIRMYQYTTSPPVARLVVDLRKPLTYTVNHIDDRLLIRLHVEARTATAKPPSLPTLAKGPGPVAVPVSTASYGNVVSADRMVSGASVTAGQDTMLLRLPRGGEIYVCPSTAVSLARAPNGSDLQVGMSIGGIEMHYALENSTDEIMTPAFRVLLRGPGEFHYAISADSRGNTCMRGLAGNTAPAIVSELMGAGVYEVQPDDKIVFHTGSVSTADTALHSGSTHIVETALPRDCGCPPPSVPTLIASNGADPNLPRAVQLAQSDEQQKLGSANSPSASKQELAGSSAEAASGPTAALPALKANEPGIVISAPMVFNAAESATVLPVADAPVAEAKAMPVVSSGRLASIQPEVSPFVPSSRDTAAPRRGFGAKVKHVLRAIFL